MNGSSILIQARDLTVRKPGRTILEGVEVVLRRGEIVTIVGPNGAGKTTLLHALLGLIPEATGSVERHPDLVVGYVPQRTHLDPILPLTVKDFLRFGRPRKREGEQEWQRRHLLWSERLDCHRLWPRPISTLSGGETQRVMLVRALSRCRDHRPNLLVLDEPTQGVDGTGEQEIYHLLATLRDQESVSVLMVSHQLHLVMAATDRVICLNRHVCCCGSPTSLRQHPDFVALFGDAILHSGIYQHQHDHWHSSNGEVRRHDDR